MYVEHQHTYILTIPCTYYVQVLIVENQAC